MVRENIADFEMGPEEALKDAVEQFKSQGVDLGNIMVRVPLAEGEVHPAVKCLEVFFFFFPSFHFLYYIFTVVLKREGTRGQYSSDCQTPRLGSPLSRLTTNLSILL